MASEYLKWKYRDVKREEQAELTPAEQRKNWWHYHKWHVATAVVLLGIGASLIAHALGFGQVRPDYQVAYVGEDPLPDGTAAAIESAYTNKEPETLKALKVNLCMECGCCSFSCPARRPLVQVNKLAKAMLNQYNAEQKAAAEKKAAKEKEKEAV